MITSDKDVALNALRRLVRSEAQEVIRLWAVENIHMIKNSIQIALDTGWEVIEHTENSTVTSDGRPIAMIGNTFLTLTHEELKRRLDDAKYQPQPPAQEPAKAETITALICPKCGDVVAKQSICPSCKLGKAGFKVLCICTSCGYEEAL